MRARHEGDRDQRCMRGYEALTHRVWESNTFQSRRKRGSCELDTSEHEHLCIPAGGWTLTAYRDNGVDTEDTAHDRVRREQDDQQDEDLDVSPPGCPCT